MKQRDKAIEFNVQRLAAAGIKIVRYTQPSKPAWVHEPQFAPGCQFHHRMRVLCDFHIRLANQHAASHPQMHDPLSLGTRLFS